MSKGTCPFNRYRERELQQVALAFHYRVGVTGIWYLTNE